MYVWLIDNKEWLFSGIGVLVLSIIMKIIKKKKENSFLNQSSGDNSTNFQANRDINFNHVHIPMTPGKNDISNSTTYKEKIERQIVEVKVKEGDYIDVPWQNEYYRITLKRIVRETFDLEHFRTVDEGVELYVNKGGSIVYGGSYARESGVNQWIMPLKQIDGDDEEPYSIYSHYMSVST